jgi:5-methylcytosine-specific restriction endonuclease McrA
LPFIRDNAWYLEPIGARDAERERRRVAAREWSDLLQERLWSDEISPRYVPEPEIAEEDEIVPEPVVSRKRLAEIRRHAREDAAAGDCTAEQAQGRWDYYRGLCWMCGESAHHFDHVKPLSRGGSKWPSNLRPVCWPCNRKKAARWPWSQALHRAAV